MKNFRSILFLIFGLPFALNAQYWNLSPASSSNIYFGGKVGIGINNPTSSLDIHTGTGATIYTALSAYSNSDPNLGIKLLTGVGDGAGFSGWNGGLGSWYGIGFHSTLDGVTRGVFNVRDGSFSLKGNLSPEKNIFIGADSYSSLIAGPAFSGAIEIKTHSGLGGSANRYIRLGYRDNAGVFNPGMSIGEDLKIGIGTTSPDEKLTVAGNMTLRNVNNASYAGASIHFTSFAHDSPGPIIKSSLHLASGVNSKSALILSSYFSSYKNELTLIDGRVGVNTSDPDEALTVKGKIHTSEVRVDLEPEVVPDYVFEKEYDLMSLSEVEAYINTNKHLPEVPSAKEMEKDGMNLKEMNLILLKKVEELTLHLIAVKKVLDEQADKIKLLESK